jgi:hypothetical protein
MRTRLARSFPDLVLHSARAVRARLHETIQSDNCVNFENSLHTSLLGSNHLFESLLRTLPAPVLISS